MKPEHILLTTDLSDEARRAFEPVGQLASFLGAKVTLLNVIYDSVAATRALPLGTPIGLSDMADEKKQAAGALADLASSLPAELETEVHVSVSTDVAESVAQTADALGVDLVALATHGRTGIRRLALGSVAEGILRHSRVPVLCFPMREEQAPASGKIEHILLTTDLSSESMRPFEPALAFARVLGCRVTVLHVVPELRAIPHGAPLAPPMPSPELPQELARAREKLEELCTSVGEQHQGTQIACEVTSHESPARGIAGYASDHGVDLIALSTHGRTGFRRLTLGSVAEEVLRRSTIPVLSFHRPEK